MLDGLQMGLGDKVGARQAKEINEVEIQGQLARILGSPSFRTSRLQSRFLRFVVEQALAGRCDQLKEFSLGVAVFERKPGFDPRLDPVVRVEAGRLRMRLSLYYAKEGRSDPIQIELPKGAYVPVFRRNEVPSARPMPVSQSARRGIAVLPLSDNSPKGDQEYFCRGLTDELIKALTKVDGLRVFAWPFDLHVRHESTDLQRVVELLEAQVVLAGSVRKSGRCTRITLRLIQLPEGQCLWSDTFDFPLKDLFAAQEEISRSIVRVLDGHIACPQGTPLISRSTGSLSAYRVYLKGRHFWNSRSETGLHHAIKCFEEAIAADRHYALAYAGLADCYSLLGFYGGPSPSRLRRKALAAAERAVSLDGTLAEARSSLGYVKAVFGWDWPGADHEFETAIALNPRLALAHHWYALAVLAATGRLAEAELSIRTACDLDPVSLAINRDVGTIFIYCRRFRSAIEQSSKTLGLEPTFHEAYWILGIANELEGNYKEALAAFREGLALSPGNPRLLGSLGHALAVSGARADAQAVLDQLRSLSRERYVCPFEFALIHAGLGEADVAVNLLTRLCSVRSFEVTSLRADPRFDSLRRERRLIALLTRIGVLPARVATNNGESSS